MKRIDIACIGKWVLSTNQQVASPASIATNCPWCSRRVVFSTRRRQHDPYRDTLSCSGDCPACAEESHFWVCDISAQAHDRGTSDEPTVKPSLFMMPAGASCLELSAIRNRIPDNLAHYCDSVLDVYKSGNLTATNILTKATLECLFSSLLPIGNSRTGLAKLMQDACRSVDLAEPMNRLSSSVANDGDLAILFDQDEHTSQECADAMMALLEQLLRFLFVLPAEFDILEQRFAELRHEHQGDHGTDADIPSRETATSEVAHVAQTHRAQASARR